MPNLFAPGLFNPGLFNPSGLQGGWPTFFDRNPIGVSQLPGQGGWNYPLVYPSDDIYKLLADAFLCFEDPYGEFKPPFSISWLYGFGEDDPVGSPPAVVHDHDAEIVDADGRVVFSSLDADAEHEAEDWLDRLRIVTWTNPVTRAVLTLVYHLYWGVGETAREYPIYFEPEKAVLDARVLMLAPPRVQSVTLGLSTFAKQPLALQNGYNTVLEAEPTVVVEGGRRSTRIVLHASPGSGRGRFSPDCGENAGPSTIRSINGVPASPAGAFYLDAGNCYRVERPVLAEITPVPERSVRVRNHALLFSNDCGPCCECDDFVAVWEGLRKMRDRYADLVDRARTIRDIYHANRDRWLKQAACRQEDRLRLILQPSCPGQLGVAVGYCNNSDRCIEGLVLNVSFQYSDASGCLGPDGEIISANTTAPFSTLICDSTFRGGYYDETRQRSVNIEFCTLGMDWPNATIRMPLVQPGAMAFVTFRLQFDDPTSGQIVEAVADAFEVGPEAPTSPGAPVPGYSPGSGCATPECEARRLVPCPVMASSPLIDECCEEESASAGEDDE